MFPIINIAGLALPMKPLLLLAGFWFGLSLAEKQAKNHKIKPEEIFNLAFYAMISWGLGGRLAFAAINSSSFILIFQKIRSHKVPVNLVQERALVARCP